MNKVVSPFSISTNDVSRSRVTVAAQIGDRGVSFDEVMHDLRQPLSVIESLAYYLELTSTDERVCSHLQKIQAMVLKTSQILERAISSQHEFQLDS